MRIAAILFFLALTSPAAAQGPGLLVLEPIGAPDPASGASIAEACRRFATEHGYHPLRSGEGSVIGTLDPGAPDDLRALVARAGVDGAVAIWLAPVAGGWEVHVGVVTAGGAGSIRLAAGSAPLVDAAVAALGAVLPAPGLVPPTGWATPAVPASSAPAVASETTTDAEPARARRDATLLVLGASIFGGFWIANSIIGAFGGYRDRSCDGWFRDCRSLPPGTSFTSEWNDFRATGWIPLAGPWIELAVKPPGEDGWPIWLVFSGVAQAAGAVLLTIGAVILAEPGPAEEPAVALVPSLGPSDVGATLLGRF